MSRATKRSFIRFVCVCMGVLPISAANATIVKIDFNDHAGGGAALAGTTTGTGFGTNVWNNNSATSAVFDEELVAPAGTNFNLTQSAGNGAVRDDVSDSNLGHSTRLLDVPLTGDVWGTFLIRMDSTTSRAGLDFNRDGSTHGDPRLLGVGDGRFFLGGIPNNAPNILAPFVGNGTIGSGTTLLYLFHMNLNTGTWDAWLNPDVTNPKAPTASAGVNVASITSVGITSYDNSATGLGGWVDFVTISDGPNAYTDVTGVAAPPTAAEWAKNGGGNWNDGTSWNTNPFVPTFGQDFLFGSALTGGTAVVNQDTDVTANSITFNNANSYQITGNPITLAGSGTVAAMQGSHTIASDLQASSRLDYTLTANSGATLNISGDFVNDNGAASSRSVELVLDGQGNGNMSGNFTNGAADVTSLRKVGTGTWIISNGSGDSAQQPNGNVTIAEGTLEILDAQAPDQGELAATNITVLAGGTFDVDAFTTYSLQPNQNLRGDGTVRATTLGISGDNQIRPGTSAGTLTVQGNVNASNAFAAPGGGFYFELSNATTIGSGINDLINVSGTLTLNSSSGGVNITVLPSGSTGLATGSYRLFNAGSVVGSAGDMTLNNSTRYNMSLSTTATQVNLNVSGSNASLTWTGSVDSKWDLATTQNWSSGSPDVFFNADVVTFSDAAANKTVDLVSTVLPASVTINNSAGNDYAIGGAGSITGGTGITKQGTGRARISTANSFDGAVTVNAGTLHAASNGALGSAVGGTTVAAGATLDVGGADLGDEPISASGTGVGGQGAITSTLAPPGSFRNIRFLTLTGPTTFGAETGGRWDVRSLNAATPGTLAGGGHAVTKEGPGIVSLADVGDTDLGDITINNGSLVLQFSSTLGRAGSVTINSGGELGLFSNDVARPVPAPSKTIVLNGGTLSNSVGATGSTVNQDIATPITLSASSTLTARGSGLFSISTPLAGAGAGITKAGNGILVLNAANTYSGNTVVQEGTLKLGTGSIANSPLVDVQAGANFDVSDNGYGVPGGQTLRVGGGATGNITVQNSSILEAGTGDRNNGTLMGNIVVDSGGTLRANTGLGVPLFTSAFVQNSNTIGAGSFRYIAFEAENYTNYNDRSTSVWAKQAAVDGSGAPALGGSALVATVSPNTTAGNDDTAQYDLVFTSPGTYTWYVRTSAPGGGQADSFFGPDRNADSANPAVRPSNASGSDRTRFGVAGELKDAEGTSMISTTWDWLRSDPTDAGQAAFVRFEQVVVTQADVDNQTVFSLEFEPRQVGAQLDKMVLVTTPAFTNLTDANLDAVAQNATGQFVASPAPFLTFDINGDLTLNSGSTFAVDIRAANDYDNLNVNGTAQLAGTLSVNLDGFTPQINDTFTILTADSLINNLTLGGPHGAGFNLSASTATDLILTFTGITALLGDYNLNGTVDAADYIVWRDSLGSMSDLRADGDGDGTITPADYGVWRANYGRQAGGAGQGAAGGVPEPGSLLLLAIGAGLLALRKRTRCDS